MGNVNHYALQKIDVLVIISLLSEKPRHLLKQDMSYQQKLGQYRNQNRTWLRLKNIEGYLKILYPPMSWSNHDFSFSNRFVKM
ncbi:MAG: hypothetical protein UR62_C0001G0016 [Candidatus Nomurabacteria bacterium GW2011_GWF2_35_12]|uniref:Uncharacterized protein n=3 Tax=Candidatus Nomuraibacteriota TaxID=1752729 RepID=A0A0G0DZJ5_9BACT|nr:MAG: hypothetical protein UR62_C0001G0016 [Candidatus Nomurabacteria bacterium GW2011_GWF2_35_12]KKP72584.1 MAG: hypothetical protein UR70_C0006G0035 [Candidatus Nomurabacteria bacterium GW2011_GWB1_35_20]KKP76611.1 MAG: hypothetical protein UR72_C0001G0056 [Parcubacteria group bacterium GW2011_GWC1_35_21]KKP78478.1 MAG: hypothetical protein UR77_C0002G0030 [Candidatus Nomurabacteria bacterium GW2011_GWC2_35_35]KKP88519.1 MAG: hypothetical protein UR92_C0003G0021 [Candidatus Nomurabacteria b